MFNELGFKLHNSSGSFLLYKFATDYDEIVVRFDLLMQTYHTTWSRFIDKNEQAFVPMTERLQNIKYSAKYGRWQAQMWHNIDVIVHCENSIIRPPQSWFYIEEPKA